MRYFWAIFSCFLLSVVVSSFLPRTVNDMLFPFFMISMLLGGIPAKIAEGKGKDLFVWWIYGWAIFPAALIHALLTERNENVLLEKGILRKCPYCAEYVKSEAVLCRFCGKDLPKLPQSIINKSEEKHEEPTQMQKILAATRGTKN